MEGFGSLLLVAPEMEAQGRNTFFMGAGGEGGEGEVAQISPS